MWQEWFAPSVISTLLASVLASVIVIIYNDKVSKIEESEKKAATLYYPLLFACNGIIQVVDEYKSLNLENLVSIFQSSSKVLDEIVYKHGTVIYLQTEYLEKFEFLVNSVNRNISFFDIKKIEEKRSFYNQNREKINKSWEITFESDEFKKIRKCAICLRNECKNQMGKL